MSSKHWTVKGLSRKFFAVTITLLFSSTLSFAQYGYNHKEDPEIGIFVGSASYQGDLIDKAFVPEFMQPGIGAFYRYYMSKHWSVRGGFSYGTVTASDKYAEDPSRVKRNLSFRSPIADVYGLLEYIPFTARPSRYASFMPYFFAGLSVFHFNPQAELDGVWYNLHDYGTEGQGLPQYPLRKPYKRTQIATPFGFGLRFKFNYSWSIGIDLRDYKTYTDYIDDVSTSYVNQADFVTAYGPEQGALAASLADRTPELGREAHKAKIKRGNDGVKDYYIFTGITITYTPHAKVKCFQF